MWIVRSNRKMSGVVGHSLAAAFNIIDATNNILDFQRAICPDRYFKYNLYANEKYGTIEFRQAEGHGDVERAIRWVKVAKNLVQASVEIPPGDWAEYARILGTGTDPKTYLLLGQTHWRRFGLPMCLWHKVERL